MCAQVCVSECGDQRWISAIFPYPPCFGGRSLTGTWNCKKTLGILLSPNFSNIRHHHTQLFCPSVLQTDLKSSYLCGKFLTNQDISPSL